MRPYVLLPLVLVGCAAPLDRSERFVDAGPSVAADVDASAPAVTCPDIPRLLIAQCGSAGCHGSTSSAAKLDLASPDVGNRLRAQKASNGDPMLDPSQPDTSVLYTKTLAKPPFGSSMPLGGPVLDDATHDCLHTWIAGVGK